MVVDIMNTNSKEHKMLCEQLDNDLVHKSLLTTILTDLNEPIVNPHSAGASVKAGRLNTKKKKGNFESEATTFVHNFKTAVKEIQDLNHFMKVQYIDDKKIINKNISSCAKFTDFESRFAALESRLFSQFSEKVGDYE